MDRGFICFSFFIKILREGMKFSGDFETRNIKQVTSSLQI